MAQFDSIAFEQYLLYNYPDIKPDNTVDIKDYDLETFKNLDNKPQLMVSQLAKLFQQSTLGYLPINFTGNSTTYGKLTKAMSETDMFSQYPGAFMVLDFSLLEVVAMNWAFTNAPRLIAYTSKHDVKRVRYNLEVMADWCGDHPEYYDYIPKLRQLNVDLGMLENKLNYILEKYGYQK